MTVGSGVKARLLDDIAPAQCDEAIEARFLPAGRFRPGLRYCWIRVLDAAGRILRCPCRRTREWEDISALRRGKVVRPHTPLGAPTSEDSGQVGVRRLVLNGDWRFQLFSSPDDADEHNPELTDFDDSDWDQVPVPSHWQLLGYDPPIYTNITYPFTLCPCRRPSLEKSNPTGVYRRRFSLPAGFAQDCEMRLLLNGVMAAAFVWLDDEELGYTVDSGTPVEFDVTSVLSRSLTSDHVLVVKVLQWSSGSLLEDQDTWWLSGIFRDVELYTLPRKNAILDYYVAAQVDAPYGDSADAAVTVDVSLRHLDDTSRVSVSFQDGHSIVTEASCSLASASCSRSAMFGEAAAIVSCSLFLNQPVKWSPEVPQLYEVVIKLQRGSDVLQVERHKLGIRDVRIRAGVLLLNGSPLLVNGVNRVEMSPNHGKAIPEAAIRADLALLKQNNFNAVRCAHCPNAPAFYRLCDDLGMLVVDEANVENHGFAMVAGLATPMCSPLYKGAVLGRTQAMFQRTKNHTCVIAWSLGNEAGMGPNQQACADWLRKCDSTRFVQYESGEKHGDATLFMGDGRHPVSDIVCPMYADPASCVTLAKEESRPVILCEYSHAMGNSNGALHLFYRAFRSESMPTVQGGFIWDFADQGLRVPRKPFPKGKSDWFLEGQLGYGGDFGPHTGKEDSFFCCNGLFTPDRGLKPAVAECKYLMQPATFEASLDDGYLMNITACVRLPRRSLDGLCMKWAANDGQGRVFAEGSKSMSGTICQLRASLAEFLQVPPTGGVFLRLRAELESDAVFAPKGHIVAQETVTLMPSAILHGTSSKSGNVVCPLVQPPLRAAAASPAGEPNVQNIGKDECRVDAAGYSARICKGEIVSLRGRSGYELLSDRHGSALGHAFWRAPTDNDRCGIDLLAPGPIKKLMPVLAKLLPQEHISFARQWRDAGLENGEVVVRETVWEGAGMTVRADFRAAGSHARLFSILTVATFKAANVHLQVTVLPAEDNKVIARLQTLPRIGARLILQPSFSRMSWMGCGPHECYPDRKAAAPMNLHQRQIEELHVPYMVPSESGGVTDVRWTALQDSSGRGLLIQYECQDAASNEESIANAGASLRPAGMRGAQVSAARWTPHAKHDSELPRAKDLPVVVHVDTAHCGVGGTGGATEAVWRFYNQYLINPSLREGWNYNLVLTPLEPGELDISASSPSQ